MTKEQTYIKWLSESGAQNSEESLRRYLSLISDEDWRSEFKHAATSSDSRYFQVRKAVCALANARGGEVFLGVTDDRRIVGTSISSEQLTEVLAQGGSPAEEWYCRDLTQPLARTIRVELSTPGKNAFVMEVRPLPVPACVVDAAGGLVMSIRQRDRDLEANGLAGIEWYRRRTREKLLRELCIEFEAQLTSIHPQAAWQFVPERFILPLFEKSRSDGSVYRLFTEEERGYLLGGGGGSAILTQFLDIGAKIRRWREEGVEASDFENRVRTLLEMAHGNLRSWKGDLQSAGVLPKA